MSLTDPAPKYNPLRNLSDVVPPFTCTDGETFPDLLDALTHCKKAGTRADITSANGVLIARVMLPAYISDRPRKRRTRAK